MRLHEIMTGNVETISADLSAEDAWNRMKLLKVHHLVVLEGKDVIGILSERDLGGPHGKSGLQGNRVKDLMSTNVVTAAPDTTVREAGNLMRGNTVGCLPVLQDNHLVGIITMTDLLDLIGKGLDRSLENKQRREGVDIPPHLRNRP